MFLTAADLETLTGYVQPAAQLRWLTRNGVRHWVARTGRPVVPRSAVDGSRQPAESGGFVLGKVS